MTISSSAATKLHDAVRRAMSDGASPNGVRESVNTALYQSVGLDDERGDSLTGNVVAQLAARGINHPRFTGHVLNESDWHHLIVVYGGGSFAEGERRLQDEFFAAMIGQVGDAVLAGERPTAPSWAGASGNGAAHEEASEGQDSEEESPAPAAPEASTEATDPPTDDVAEDADTEAEAVAGADEDTSAEAEPALVEASTSELAPGTHASPPSWLFGRSREHHD